MLAGQTVRTAGASAIKIHLLTRTATLDTKATTAARMSITTTSVKDSDEAMRTPSMAVTPMEPIREAWRTSLALSFQVY